jgi:hypothetical protein
MSDNAMTDLTNLKAPFSQTELDWRIVRAKDGDGGQVMAIVAPYVTNRAIMERLDETVGPSNWRNEYTDGPDGGILCGLSIRIDGEWVTKWDGAENTNLEPVKGGLSGAMKRAAVQWGIGRYLYSIETVFAAVNQNGKYRGKSPNGTHFKWDPPQLPAWALPEGEEPEKPRPAPRTLHKDESKEKQEIRKMLNEYGDAFEDHWKERIQELLDDPTVTKAKLRDVIDNMNGKVEEAIAAAQQEMEY